ncbi:MAG: glucose 1-dehydrogenase [Trueperaceae bacterium]|nr:glucose 1-dehydrogenase [Trueperaceae bacterium]
MKRFDLTGKVAIVTGGNGGIGLGMAEGLAEAGANIVIAARNQEKSAKALEQVKRYGTEVLALSCDVAEPDSVKTMVQSVIEQFGSINILVNNAGINIRKPPEDLTFEEWRKVVSINLDSAFLCSQACYTHMKAAGGGKILNNGSMLSLFGSSWGAPYSASKGGMVQLTKSLAAAWAKDNIQVNCFLPGFIETPLTESARTQIQGVDEKVTNKTMAKRWGQAEDMKGIAIFLASSASDFITATAIPVDGGFSAQLY